MCLRNRNQTVQTHAKIEIEKKEHISVHTKKEKRHFSFLLLFPLSRNGRLYYQRSSCLNSRFRSFFPICSAPRACRRQPRRRRRRPNHAASVCARARAKEPQRNEILSKPRSKKGPNNRTEIRANEVSVRAEETRDNTPGSGSGRRRLFSKVALTLRRRPEKKEKEKCASRCVERLGG